MIEYGKTCKDYAAAADRVGFSKQEITTICKKCTVPHNYGVRLRVSVPTECHLFNAIISRFAVKELPPPPVRPCDFIVGACRDYVGAVFAWSRAKKICVGCAGSGRVPGVPGCALYDERNKQK